MGDTDVSDAVRDVEIDAADDDGKDDDGDEGGEQEAAAFGLGKGEFGHGGKDTAKKVVGCWLLVDGRAREGLIKSSIFPRRLKPRSKQAVCGGTKVPPFQNVDLCRDFLGEVFLDEVLVHEDGDEGGGWDGDQSADDAGQFCAGDEGDEDGEAHEVDAVTHDARSEEGALDVDVDEVKDEDAGHLGPGVEGRDQADEQDGNDAAGDGDAVHQAHEDAEQDEVADVQQAEDEGAGEAEDEHQRGLAEEPLAGAPFGRAEGGGEAEAVFEERATAASGRRTPLRA